LFLKTAQLRAATARQRVIDAFAAHAIGADRLILEADIPDRGEHLAAYHRVDIALDTFPYNGVTTSAEALWMGVPVLTLAGERFLSRQGLGLLMNAGLPDWVAVSPDAYVAKAAQGAANLPELARLRVRMRDRLRTSAGFDAPRFARHFEDALWQMWRHHEDG
jgi:predicted O-linked N-acetylglucosamine transferase (SPINDLY family)